MFSARVKFGIEPSPWPEREVPVIGVFGGTFDPVHFGHLRTAYELSDQLRLTRTLMILSRSPPHRPAPVATVQQRWRMLELALAADDRLEADARELDRDGPSYMVDTLASLREDVGDIPLCLLLGADAFSDLAKWDRWRQLFEFANIAVAGRPGHSAEIGGRLAGALAGRVVTTPAALRDHVAGKVIQLELTQLEISSTQIRRQVSQGLTPRYLMPEAVVSFLDTQAIYR